MMTFQQYLERFEHILNSPKPEAPYDNPDYLNYTKLNWSRMNRWLKKGVISNELSEAIRNLQAPQKWILITEPWCGDAAHNVPFIYMLSKLNPLIELQIELRDSEPFRIDQYLTNGGKSIPKLVVQDLSGKDLFTWGPRPAACQVVYDELKAQNADFDAMKIALQNWYNHDEGQSSQQEFIGLLK